MADDLHTAGICSGRGSWWMNSARSSAGLDGQIAISSTSIADIDARGSTFSWSAGESKSRSCEESTGSASAGSSITFQDTHLNPSMNWNETLLGGKADTRIQAMHQDDLSKRPYWHDGLLIDSYRAHVGVEESSTNLFKEINHGKNFLLDKHLLNSSNEASASFGSPSRLLQTFITSEANPPLSIYGNPYLHHQSSTATASHESLSELLQPSWTKFSQLVKPSPLKNQLQFSNSTPFWNPSSTAMNEVSSGFYPSVPSQFISQQKPSYSNLIVKEKSLLNSEQVQDSCSSAKKKSSSGDDHQPTFKKPRIETPSPLPTFKVRKEKLGDRITALQQLVSPFGKTDTASVLHEAFEYIKFLHEQVSVLSTPYMKNEDLTQHQQGLERLNDGEGPKQDLRSRGLCLVPITSTYPVATETVAEFWHPTFGGSFR
ncbi:transcription factor bHLH112-like isoform X2 [Ananas comosus]|uniref:Transcription factor bHLH112-like isoform X2 n=1 Tax=Ananas comosus TaxID=4615 RepID=A0A6P5EXG6_ANACO|nr:transcription factor bHLH112-like isoform X2 [Ananas comosus]